MQNKMVLAIQRVYLLWQTVRDGASQDSAPSSRTSYLHLCALPPTTLRLGPILRLELAPGISLVHISEQYPEKEAGLLSLLRFVLRIREIVTRSPSLPHRRYPFMSPWLQMALALARGRNPSACPCLTSAGKGYIWIKWGQLPPSLGISQDSCGLHIRLRMWEQYSDINGCCSNLIRC